MTRGSKGAKGLKRGSGAPTGGRTNRRTRPSGSPTSGRIAATQGSGESPNPLLGPRGRWSRRVMAFFCSLMALGLGTVVAVAGTMMLRDGDEWRHQAETQRERHFRRKPNRGAIYDRNGDPLALSVKAPTAILDARTLLEGVSDDDLERVSRDAAERVAAVLSLDVERVAKQIRRRGRYALLKRGVSATEAMELRALGSGELRERRLRGLAIQAEARRFYPAREAASAIIGFVSPDGEGKDGLELALNETLKGGTERWSGLRDRRGKVLLVDGYQHPGHLAGHDVTLTIDVALQRVVERELELSATMHQAKSASAVAIDPHTGEILAMANWPDYNPNDVRQSAVAERRNRTIADRFEPGSTMKVFTMAAALDEGVVRLGSTRYCHKGTYFVDGVRITDTHPGETMTMTEIIGVSSNICAAKIGLELGQARLHDYMRKFGFGQRTGISLTGETAGTIRPLKRPWNNVETAVASYGQGVSVTNLQMAMAIGAIANGGELMKPYLVKSVVSPRGEVIRKGVPEVVRRVVSERVTQDLRRMMLAVTSPHGTAPQAALAGYNVAGKTGTSEKARTRGRGYSRDARVASFVGMVPDKDPVVAIAVMVDEPRVERSGGEVAGPIFRRIAEAALRRRAVRPRDPGDVAWGHLARMTTRADAAYRAFAESADEPEAGVPALARNRPVNAEEDQAVIPNLVGLPARSALRRALRVGVRPELRGSGLVVQQIPPAGSALHAGDSVTLVLAPTP